MSALPFGPLGKHQPLLLRCGKGRLPLGQGRGETLEARRVAGVEVRVGEERADAAGVIVKADAPWKTLPELLEFPAALIEAEGDTLWLRFDGLAPGLEAALERLVFRLHRRQVAVTRRLD